MTKFFRGVLTLQGHESDDHRILSGVTWRDLPLTLRIQTEDFGGHDGASPVGSMQRIETSTPEAMAALGFTVPEGSQPVYVEGVFSDSPEGQLAAQWLDEKVLRGCSVDAGAVEAVDEIVDPATGATVGMDQIMETWDQIEAAEILGNDAEAAALYEWLDSLYYRTNFTAYEISAATLVACPAFGECVLETWAGPGFAAGESEPITAPTAAPVTASRRESLREKFGLAPAPAAAASARQRLSALIHRADDGELVAGFSPSSMVDTAGVTRFEQVQAAAPAKMRADWFKPIEATGPVKFTITDEGRMMGHLFTWDSCHRSYTGRCFAPTFLRDDPQFQDFHVGEAALDDGTRLRVGVLTYAAMHAGDHDGLTPAELIEMMENTGTQLGPVRLHADDFGLQACGQVYDDVPPTQAARALAGFPSYDARRVAGRLRLYGLHVVNTPGHPMYEETDGQVQRMVASVAPTVGPHTAAAQAAATTTCGCGGASHAPDGSPVGTEASGACSCGPDRLTAAALADLAHLDAAMRVRRTLARQ